MLRPPATLCVALRAGIALQAGARAHLLLWGSDNRDSAGCGSIFHNQAVDKKIPLQKEIVGKAAG